MCGLIGFSGSSETYDWKKIAALMLLNTERGRDASGFYYPIPRSNKYILRKSDEAFTKELVYDKSLMNSTNLFIGHDRAASSGFKNKDNAHPFIFENEHQVVCAHNGTLTWLIDLLEFMRDSLPNYKDSFYSNVINVDSKVFSMYFSIAGVKAKKVLEYYDGAAALLFSDLNNSDILYAYTDGARPLHYGFIGSDMYISSEKEPLQFIGCKKIKHFDNLTVYEIEKGKIKSREKISRKKIPSKAVQHYSSHTNAYASSTVNYSSSSTPDISYRELRTLKDFANSLDIDDLPLVPAGDVCEIQSNEQMYQLICKYRSGSVRRQPLGQTFITRHYDDMSYKIGINKEKKVLILTTFTKIVKGNTDYPEEVVKVDFIDMIKLKKMLEESVTEALKNNHIEVDDTKSDLLKLSLICDLQDLQKELTNFSKQILMHTSVDDVTFEQQVHNFSRDIETVETSLDEEDVLEIQTLSEAYDEFKDAISREGIEFGFLKNIDNLMTEIMIKDKNYTVIEEDGN